MMKLRVAVYVSAATLCLLFASPIASSSESNTTTQPLAATWKVLVYLDADNNLDTTLGGEDVDVVQTDMNELMAIGSTMNVDVFALVDRFEGPGKLYKVLPGSLQEMTAYEFHNEELNMGDPRILRSFVSFVSNESDAQQTIIVFWDHGTPYYIAWDDNPYEGWEGAPDALTHKEVIAALDGFHIDILGADECLVGQIEVACEYARFAEIDYLVASECYTGWRGIAYDRIIEEIDTNPGITSRELAGAIAGHFTEQFSVPPYKVEMVNSKAAIDLAVMDELSESIFDLTNLLIPKIERYYGAITSAKGDAQILYGATAVSRFDLGMLVGNLMDGIGDQKVKQACEDVLEVYSRAILAIGTTKVTEDKHTGLGIFLPMTPNRSLEEFMLGGSVEEYRSYIFPQLGWMAFIEAYLDAHGGLEAGGG